MKGGKLTYAPTTFAERGAAVPFTTPVLSQTRVRPGERHSLEILAPSFSEGKGIYVIPWRMAPEMVSMTVHDRFLHQVIEADGAVTPQAVRAASLKAARNGLAGPEAARAARAALAQDEEYRGITHFLLLIELMRAAGHDSLEALRESFGAPDGKAVVKRYINAAAARLKLEPRALYDRLEEVSGVMSPIGLAHAPQPGRLRLRLAELDLFAGDMAEWAGADLSDAGPVGVFCAGVARQTHSLGQGLLREFDRRARSVGKIMRDWDGQAAEISALAERLVWLTDGWEFIAASWREAAKRGRQDQQMTVSEIFRVLPLVPRDESEFRQADDACAVMKGHRRAVKAYEDWRSGALDVDLVHRIEKARALAA